MLLRKLWAVAIVVVMCGTALPGNGAVFLRKVYELDRKRHGAHGQDIHNFEG